mgnify:CR=1 FL=1
MAGFVSKIPNLVTTTLGLLKSVASDGRSVNRTSPFKSRPIVMLKGVPEVTRSNGLKLNPHGASETTVQSEPMTHVA